MNHDLLYPLRRLHGMIHEYQSERKHILSFQQRLNDVRHHNGIILIGTPTHSNIGDSAIVIAQIEFLCQLGIERNNILEITFHEYYQYRTLLKKCISSEQLLCCPGGGNMGNQWEREDRLRFDLMDDFPKNPIIVFPQTIYYLPDAKSEADKAIAAQYYGNHADLTLVAREQSSYIIMRDMFPNTKVLLVPDIVLSSTIEMYGITSQQRCGTLMCMRRDPEKTLSSDDEICIEQYLSKNSLKYRLTDMHTAGSITTQTRNEHVRNKMLEFASAQLVITDRLHGMIFSAITGTPCVVFGNYNHKVSGTYEWIKHLPYIKYVNSVEEMATVIPELLSMENCWFNNTPLAPYYEDLAKEVCHTWQKSV